MRLDLRYLPFRLPATLGRCRHWYDPQNGKVLLYVQHPTSIDPQNDETVADCISWVVEQFDIKHLAFDGWRWPTRVVVKAGGRFFVVQPDGSEQFLPREQLTRQLGPPGEQRTRSPEPTDRFLLRGWFQGTVHGVDEPGHQTRQIEACVRLYPHKPALIRAFEQALGALYERAPEFLHEPWLALFRRRQAKNYVDFSFLAAAAAMAKRIGIDLARFPAVERVEKLQVGGMMLRVNFEEATQDVERLLEKLRPRVPYELSEDLASLHRECTEADGSQADKAGDHQWQYFFFHLKDCALAYGLGLGDYLTFEAVLEKAEASFALLSGPTALADLRQETRQLFMTLVEQSSDPARGRLFLDTVETLHTLRKMCELKLTPEEHQEALRRGADSSFVHKLVQLHIPWNVAPHTLETALKLAKDFYYHALSRARHIADVVGHWFDSPHDREDHVRLLATTGFLSSTICQELASQHRAYYLILPQLTLPAGQDGEEPVDRFYEALYQAYRERYGL